MPATCSLLMLKGLGSLQGTRILYFASIQASRFGRIVDMHSHIGDSPSPELNGAVDDNSFKGVVQPWLRALDGLNTHDDSFRLSIAGGVTTSLVLPGSANGIGERI